MRLADGVVTLSAHEIVGFLSFFGIVLIIVGIYMLIRIRNDGP